MAIIVMLILILTSISVRAGTGEIFDNTRKNDQSPFDDLNEPPAPSIREREVNQVLSSARTAFTENRGQLGNDEVLFYVQSGNVWFTDDGVYFELIDDGRVESPESRSRESKYRGRGSQFGGQGPATGLFKSVILKQEFMGANQVVPEGRQPLGWNSNFFYGNDPLNWQTEVPNYGEVYYPNLYDGIDLRYYTATDGLKYDLLVHPGADPHQIRIRYDGADGLEVNDMGNLVIKTQVKDIIDSDLFIYQDYTDKYHRVEGKFVKHDDLEYGFQMLGNYNKQKTLVIDPLVNLDFSTFFGGTISDNSNDIGTDGVGNIYVAGDTRSTNFPTTNGANDTSFNGGLSDIFVLKMNPVGTQLLYSTFIGGDNRDYGRGLAVDSGGNAYVIADTYSTNFPTSVSALDKVLNGTIEAVVFKLDPTGANLVYSTFLGGDGTEEGRDIAIDNSGNAYVTGNTFSTDFPTSLNAYKKTRTGSWGWDIYVSKLNPTGSTLIYSTYMGGSFNDNAYGIEVDSSGYAYITGFTESSDFPTSPWALDRTLSLHEKAFVFKLNQTATGLEFSTFIGGGSDDYGYDIAIDKTGHSYVTGITTSLDFPTTTGAFDETLNSFGMGNPDLFVSKLNHNGSALNFSTFVGGSNKDDGYGIAIDPFGNSYVTGRTYSGNFPTTPDAYNRTRGKYSAAFMFKLAANGSTMIYSTFIGGDGNETGKGITLGPRGDAIITGVTSSTDFPQTTGTYNTTTSGWYDVIVAKFSFQPKINISLLSLLKDNEQVSIVYARNGHYTIRTNLIHTAKLSGFENVQLAFDPLGQNIKLQWNYTTGQFTEISDPNDYITIDSSSKALNIFSLWTIDFNVTFNWTYPDEELHSIQAYASCTSLSPTWLNKTGIYQVENDLEFNGTLVVKGEDDRIIQPDDLVRGGERLNWSGLTVVYENSNSTIFPPDEEFDVVVRDGHSKSWWCSPGPGELSNMSTIAPNETHSNGFTYSIALSGIPEYCDATAETFTINIDGDNVTFTDNTPSNNTWQTISNVLVSVNITDLGGGVINSKSVKHQVSTNNGSSWSDWETVYGLLLAESMIVKDSVELLEGSDNLIKWQAMDSLGNGPTESEPYRILVDTEGVTYSNPWPSHNEESATEQVDFGITISDATSGVNASAIEYAVSHDKGKIWSAWIHVEGLNDSSTVMVNTNHTFTNGTDNIIKWRATDVAGNEPVESPWYVISVNTWNPKNKPKVVLLSPPQGFTVNETGVMLKWELEDRTMTGITYDIYFDTVTPPELYKTDITETSFFKDGLTDGATYYWRVIPRRGVLEGLCSSGVWWFQVYLDYTGPGTNFKISITGPMSISIYPGENKSIPLTITNLGTNKDMIKLELQAGQLSDYIDFEDYSILELECTGYATRTLNIDLPLDAQPGNSEIIVTAISLNSGEKERVNHFISVEIKKPDGPGPNGPGTDPNASQPNITEQNPDEKANELLMFSVIAIIILIMALTIFVLKRKKKKEQELLPAGAVTVKPLPTHIVDSQMPGVITRTQLPGTVSAGTAAQQHTVMAVAPAPPPKLIPQVQPLPQLPPAPQAQTQAQAQPQPTAAIATQPQAEITPTGIQQPAVASSTPAPAPAPTVAAQGYQGPTVHLPPSVAGPTTTPAPITTTPTQTPTQTPTLTMAELEAQRLQAIRQQQTTDTNTITEPSAQPPISIVNQQPSIAKPEVQKKDLSN